MIEKCNFKYGWIDAEGNIHNETTFTDGCYRCNLANGMKCPGEMKCILYTLYYYEEEEP